MQCNVMQILLIRIFALINQIKVKWQIIFLKYSLQSQLTAQVLIVFCTVLKLLLLNLNLNIICVFISCDLWLY